MRSRIVLTFADASEDREFIWDQSESSEWYEARVLSGGVLGIFHVTDHPAGDGPRERLVEAYTRWLKVVTE